MDKTQQDLVMTLESRQLFKALIEEEWEINHGPSKRAFLLYLKARATTDCTIGGRRYSICFGCSAQLHRVTAADMANWGCPGATERDVKRWTKLYRDEGMIATIVRRSNKAERGTQIVLTDWSKWHGTKNVPWPDGCEPLRAAAQRATAIRDRNRNLLPLKRRRSCSRPTPDVEQAAKCENRTSQRANQYGKQSSKTCTLVNDQSTQNSASYKDKVLSPEKVLSCQPRAREAFAFERPVLRITAEQDASFARAFPWVDRQAEYLKMVSWLVGNGKQRKNHGRFAQNWFSKMKPEDRPPGNSGGMEIPNAECFHTG